MRTTTAIIVAIAGSAAAQPTFVDATDRVGLGGVSTARVLFADLNNDLRPDAVLDRRRVFLNTPGEDGEPRFTELVNTGLPEPANGDCLVFADLDNDGTLDAVLTRNLNVNAEGYAPPPAGTPQRTCWLPGNGDGTFGSPLGSFQEIDAAAPRTTACIAVGDANRDGLLDLYLGNWYTEYGNSVNAFANDLLIQNVGSADEGLLTFNRRALDDAGRRTQPAIDLLDPQPAPAENADESRTERDDPYGRPTYGVMIASLLPGRASAPPQLIELNYGRRWNRLWVHDTVTDGWADEGKALGFAGDLITHGRYPAWLAERARTDPRFAREDEKPFRANGNTFDAALGDIDFDGDLDVFVSEITHGWAGESSDRSRFLVQQRYGAFSSTPRLSVDRLPPDPAIRNWNQGDLFCELLDADHDGRLDLLLSSGDYPDDQRLRLYRQQPDGTFINITAWSGLDNDGSQQISLADVDLDGDTDILVGQTFNRLPAGSRSGRTPRAKLYLNQAVEREQGASLVLRLTGDPARGVNRDALGAVVRIDADLDDNPATPPVRLVRTLVGIGGHAGKQHAFEVHAGLGLARTATVEVDWPGASVSPTVVTVTPGRWAITMDGARSLNGE